MPQGTPGIGIVDRRSQERSEATVALERRGHADEFVIHARQVRAQTFFCGEDYKLYLDLLAEHTAAADVEVWAWVLMLTAHQVPERP